MLSRRTARAVAELFGQEFTTNRVRARTHGRLEAPIDHAVMMATSTVYDFLFDHGYDPWFCNLLSSFGNRESLENAIKKLHTGESVTGTEWTWEQRAAKGQD